MNPPYLIDLVSADADFRTKGYSTGWRASPHTLFEWSKGGPWHLDIEGRPRILVPEKSVLVIPAGTRHHLLYLGKQKMKSWWRYLDWTGAGGFPLRIELKDLPYFKPGISVQIKKLLEPLHFGSRGKDPSIENHSRIQTALHQLVGLVESDPEETLRVGGALRFPRLQPVFDFLKTNWMKPVSRRHLAELIPLSEMRFHVLWTKEMGFAPMRYLQALRIRKVQELLLLTDKGLAEIAEATGYGTIFSLSRSFTRETGKSPSAYRKQMKGQYRETSAVPVE